MLREGDFPTKLLEGPENRAGAPRETLWARLAVFLETDDRPAEVPRVLLSAVLGPATTSESTPANTAAVATTKDENSFRKAFMAGPYAIKVLSRGKAPERQ